MAAAWTDSTTPSTLAPDLAGRAAVGSLPLDGCCEALINSQARGNRQARTAHGNRQARTARHTVGLHTDGILPFTCTRILPFTRTLPCASTSPSHLQDEVMMGIDEAGRGPTLGPMVYGSAFCRVEDEARLKAMGFADSKTLNEARRESLWAELQAVGFIGWRIRVLHAQEISAGMLRRFKSYNLNAMSHDAAIMLVRQVIELGVNLRYLYVDTVGDPGVYQTKLESIFPNLNITVAKKADSIYPIVSVSKEASAPLSGHINT